MSDETPRFLRPAEVAKLVGKSLSGVYNDIAKGPRRGGLPSVHIGGSVRVPASALRELEAKARREAEE